MIPTKIARHISITSIVQSATIDKRDLLILNENYPDWVLNVINNKEKIHNILVIRDFDKISIEEQKLFVDIICNNCVSSEKLPSNLKIVINSEKKCKIIPEIRDVIQYFEV